MLRSGSRCRTSLWQVFLSKTLAPILLPEVGPISLSWADRECCHTVSAGLLQPVLPNFRVASPGGFYIRPNQTVRIGRDTDRDNNDVVFAHSAVSRNHFELYSITVDEEGRHTPLVFVRDRQSSNGTLLNKKCVGKKPGITPGRLLQNGDIISIDSYITFKFYQLEEGSSFPCLTARQREELKVP